MQRNSISRGEWLTSQGSAYLMKPSSHCQNTWTPSAIFRRQHLPRTFAAGLALLIRLRPMHNCATLWHHSNHFSAQCADSNGHQNLKEPSKHLKSLSSQRSAMVPKSSTHRNEPAYAQIGIVKASGTSCHRNIVRVSRVYLIAVQIVGGSRWPDLIPVSLDLVAANNSPIKIAGAIILRLQGHSPDSEPFSCATMVYVSEAARGFHLSWEAMMDLGIVSPNFPSVGGAADPAVTHQPPTRSTERQGSLNAGGLAQDTDSIDSCSCPPRTVAAVRPVALPFECTTANNAKMEVWLLIRFASSTFKTCPHRPLPCMTGPQVEINMEDSVIPIAVHTAAPVPIH